MMDDEQHQSKAALPAKDQDIQLPSRPATKLPPLPKSTSVLYLFSAFALF